MILQYNQRLWLAPDAAEVGTWEWFIATNEYYWSEEIWQLYGLAPNSCVANYENWLKTVYPPDRDRIHETFQLAITQGIEFKLEWRIHSNSSNSVRWLMAHGRPLRETSDTITSYVGIVFDITERKHAEQALLISEERYRRIIGTVPGVVYDYILYPDGTNRFLYLGPRLKEILELDETALLANSNLFWEIIHPEDRELVRAEDLAAHRERRLFNSECRIITPTGKNKWIHITAKACRGLEYNECQPFCECAILRENNQDCAPTVWSGIILDITARKEAEQAIRENENIYYSLFKNLLNAVAYCRILYQSESIQDFICLSVNDSFTTQTGLQDVLGRRASEVIPGIREQDQELFIILDRVVRTGSPERFELYMRSLQQWISAAAYSPAPLHFVLVFDVITERKQSEARLRKLSLAVEQSPTSIVITNTAAEIEYVNESFSRITGYAFHEVKGKNPRFLQSGETPRNHYQSLWQALAQGESWQGEFINRRKNGELFVEYETLTPIRQNDGTITHYLAIKEDITEKKRLYQELEQHRLLLEELVQERTRQLQEANQVLERTSAQVADLYNNAPCGYHSLDTQGRYLAVNDTELTMLGYSREELIGKKFFRDLVAPDSLDRFNANFHNLLKVGRIRDLEYNLICKNGAILPVIINTDTVCDAKGNFLYCRSTLFDDTERKRRDQQIVLLNRHYWAELAHRAEEAEAATRAKSAFLANMSHEIRTPMNSILGLVHLLRRGIVDPDHLDKLDKITNAAQHLLSIINSVLDFSKIEAGRFQLELRDFSLRELFDKVTAMIYSRLRDKGLNLTIDQELSYDWLRGDPIRLSQILLNYLDNAVKFTDQGKITLRVRLLEEKDNELLIRFEVQDTGIGIDLNQFSRIFSAFEQADNSITRRYGGTGLGLAINHRLAILMGGNTGVESNLGGGSTFWMTARLQHGKKYNWDGVLTSEQILAEEFHGARILVLEDNILSQEIISELLTGVGLKVDLVSELSATLDKVREQNYDLILINIHSPIMKALVTTRAIRALPHQEHLPILAISANVFPEDRQQCLDAGMDDFVAKPVVPEVLFASLVKWLRSYMTKKTRPVNSAAPIPAVEQYTSLPTALLNIPGLDTRLGLQIQNGRVDSYIRLLHDFVRYHREDLIRLDQNLLRGDWRGACQLVHSLQEIAGNLGATDLKMQAQKLENALHSTTTVSSEIESLRTIAQAKLTAFVDGILTLPISDPTVIRQTKILPSTSKPVLQLLAQLEKLLIANEYSGLTFLQENSQQLQVILGEKVTELTRVVERFDYDSALRLIRSARQKK